LKKVFNFLYVEQNISRLKYLLNLFGLSVEELLEKISKGLNNPVTQKELFSKKIKLSHLKRIDSLFNKGLHFYLDPKTPEKLKEASVFFRKESFNSELNFGARKVVNEFEEFKISLSAISKMADLKSDRTIKVYNTKDNPKFVAKELRKLLFPGYSSDLKEFLKSLIGKFAEFNILVFEFVETWNKKEKANIDGFFLNPNVIVLKRHQKAFRREIFTLVHELGHFLLNEEEIDILDYQQISKTNSSEIERWCNDFAFYFLAGNYANEINKIQKADSSNDYQFEIIEEVSKLTHLSQIALFTRLLYDNKLSNHDYSKIKTELFEKYQDKLEQEKMMRDFEKEKGIKQGGAAPQPIKSPLLISTIQTAFYEGILNEYEVCKRLNIKPEKLENYIS
jgi:Zn-dependent peptidase ImmA (M78 family)